MQVSKDHIIGIVIAITVIFLMAAGFLLLYVFLYNKRKKRHIEEKEKLQAAFEEELIRAQMEVQEQTLRTIGRELHDNIGQLLSLTRITLSTIPVISYAEKDRKKIGNSLEYLNTSIGQLRQLAAVLHAENLLSTGLQEAVKTQLDRLSGSEIYKVHWNVEGQPANKIDPQKELIAFRIVQEVINNIIKHAAASFIRAAFNYQPGIVEIMIADDGRGFEPEKSISAGKGMGLGNLVKRAKMIGGSLDIASSLEKGTTITLQFPYTN